MAVPTAALMTLLNERRAQQQADMWTTEQMQQGAAAMNAPQQIAPQAASEVKPRVSPPVTDWQQHDVLGAKRAMGLESQAIDHANQKDLLDYKAKLQQRMRRGTGVGPVTKLVNEILQLSTTTADSPEQRQQIEKRIQVRMSQLEGLGRAGQIEAQRIKQFAVPTIPGGGEKFSQQRFLEGMEGKQRATSEQHKRDIAQARLEAWIQAQSDKNAAGAAAALAKILGGPGGLMVDPQSPDNARLREIAERGVRGGQAPTGPSPGTRKLINGQVWELQADGSIVPVK